MTELTAADGHKLDCWMQESAGAARGGVVIVQEIFGVTDQLKGVAERYAAAGYNVAIPALFDRSEKGCMVPFDQAPRGRELMMAADLDATMTDIDAAVQALAAKGGKVAVIGFCWGGGLALRAAQKLDIAGGVAFYGTRLPQYLDCPLKAPMLGHFGSKDDHVPPEMLAAAKAYLPEFEIRMYDAGHAFANDARPAAYNEAAASLAHDRTLAFLARHVG
jgi:carboxymethylenebutenolidase